MQHHERCGQLEVDHFDPRKKKEVIQEYDNLFPASRHCNGKKSNSWPTAAEQRAGCRFLNPCKELDYDEQIFEDPRTHLLVGTTVAARWHIRMCGLNADNLVKERAKRAKYWHDYRTRGITVKKGSLDNAVELIRSFKSELELMIPEIAAVAAAR